MVSSGRTASTGTQVISDMLHLILPFSSPGGGSHGGRDTEGGDSCTIGKIWYVTHPLRQLFEGDDKGG